MGLSIVAKIDNLMALTVTNFSIKAEITKNPIKYKKGAKSFAGDIDEVEDWIASGMSKVIFIPAGFVMILNRIMTLIYTCVYFYFIPFLVLLLKEYLAYYYPKSVE